MPKFSEVVILPIIEKQLADLLEDLNRDAPPYEELYNDERFAKLGRLQRMKDMLLEKCNE